MWESIEVRSYTAHTLCIIKIFFCNVFFYLKKLCRYLKKTLITATEPNRVMPVKIGNLTTDGSIISSVFAFMTAYSFSLVILTLLISLSGLGFETSFGAVVACITNSGPGIGPIVGPAGNFSSLSDYAKYVLSFAMLLGRLDILTIIVIFTRSFWQN